MEKVLGYRLSGGIQGIEARSTTRLRVAVGSKSALRRGFRNNIVLTIMTEGDVPC
jgi:hypothetical protein